MAACVVHPLPLVATATAVSMELNFIKLLEEVQILIWIRIEQMLYYELGRGGGGHA